jgi:hypothetical protein
MENDNESIRALALTLFQKRKLNEKQAWKKAKKFLETDIDLEEHQEKTKFRRPHSRFYS